LYSQILCPVLVHFEKAYPSLGLTLVELF